MLKGPPKNSKDMQKAQILAFPQCALDVQKFLEWNDDATKMAGSYWSHVLDLTSDPDAWYLLEQLGSSSTEP
jgi:hypothetical protein